jgi:hypothetical protein
VQSFEKSVGIRVSSAKPETSQILQMAEMPKVHCAFASRITRRIGALFHGPAML